eukprot:GFUD01012504.1.p1 GENE.GFUD01012504.1~~GFUD01012504.1.p1  ORF type:complete len:236 (+),score=49.73 GFUD01012504.1:79-786(+)
MNLLILPLLLLPFLGYSEGKEKSPTIGNRIPTLCLTTEGERCIFPFMFEGQKHSKCTYTSSFVPWCPTFLDSEGIVVNNRWGDCSTDRHSSCEIEPNYFSTANCIPGETFSDDCNTCVCRSNGLAVCTLSVCPVKCSVVTGPATGSECAFPFTWQGKTWTGCAPWTYGGPDQGKVWCSTATNNNGGHVNGKGNYGICGPDCPTGTDQEPIIIEGRINLIPNDVIVFEESVNLAPT